MATYEIIKGLSHDKWLSQRSQGIGSSEVGTLMGVNPYESPYQLWLRKTGRDNTPKAETFAMTAGHYLEDAVSHFYSDKTGNRIIKSSAGDWLAVDKKRPYLRVSPDRTFWLAGMPQQKQFKGIVECKTTQRKIEQDNIPLYWYCQLQYQMGVMQLRHGALAWLTAGREFGHQDYELNSDFYNEMTARIEEFWCKNVKENIEPDITTAEDVCAKYMHSSLGKVVVANNEICTVVNELKGIKTELTTLKLRQTELENQIKMAMQDGESLLDQYGTVLCTWKTAKDSTKFDEKAFQKEHPEEYEKFLQTKQGSRRFLLK